MSSQMTVRLPDGTVAPAEPRHPDTSLRRDAALRPGPLHVAGRTRPYPGPLPKPPQEDTEDPAPGAEPATPAPAVPPAGEGAGKLALPGAEDDEQDAQEPPQEELPLEPLPEPVCGLV